MKMCSILDPFIFLLNAQLDFSFDMTHLGDMSRSDIIMDGRNRSHSLTHKATSSHFVCSATFMHAVFERKISYSAEQERKFIGKVQPSK